MREILALMLDEVFGRLNKEKEEEFKNKQVETKSTKAMECIH